MNVENIIKEVFKEASKGKITIDSFMGEWVFYVKFFINIEGNANTKNTNYPILKIDNYKIFLEKCKKYLKVAYNFYSSDRSYYDLDDDNAYIKKLFTDLIVNMTYHNFDDVNAYIDLKTNQLLDKTIKEGNFLIGKYNELDIYCKISKNVSNLETPYRMTIAFKEDNQKFTLPTLNFSVFNNEAYLMCIQNTTKNDNKNILSKKLDRYFRKVNKDVDINDDISKISPNSLVALTIFNEFMKSVGVNKIIANNFMPIRYNNGKVRVFNKYKDDENKKKENIEMIDYIQSNITNKFMNLLLRYNYHFTSSCIEYDDIKDEMILELGDVNDRGDNILYDIANSIKIVDKKIR